ncbi:Rho GTPase activation protein [Parasitella parasitica]|nr:Rho GTPase activation protein [Parasitella parasitica]
MISENTLSRSKSNSAASNTRTISRMETFKRALTTSRRKNSSANSSITTTQPLYISLPDVEQLNRYHTTPPLSPPTASTATTNNQISTAIALPELDPKQDCIIRHIAVLHIESHVDDPVLEDLLNISSKKPSSPAVSLWGKLKTHILTPTAECPPPPLPSLATFEKKIGVSLYNLSSGSLKSQASSCSSSFEKWKSECPVVDSCFSPNSLVPSFLQDCIIALIDQGITTEGIFRKNGNIRGLKEMCEALDSQPNRQNWADFFRNLPSIQLAAFIKRFLRELPEPLLSFKLYKLFIMSSKATTLIGALNIIHYAVCILPKPNRDILLTILALLHWVAQHSAVNKMDFENLARVITPNILYASQEKKQQTYDLMDISTCHGS